MWHGDHEGETRPLAGRGRGSSRSAGGAGGGGAPAAPGGGGGGPGAPAGPGGQGRGGGVPGRLAGQRRLARAVEDDVVRFRLPALLAFDFEPGGVHRPNQAEVVSFWLRRASALPAAIAWPRAVLATLFAALNHADMYGFLATEVSNRGITGSGTTKLPRR